MKNIKRISLLLSWKICNSRLCWILLLLVLSVGLKAQTKTVSGTIVDASGESIIGVNIVVKGTTNGVITDFDGNFTLTNVPEKGIISVTYIGYKSQEISVAGQSVFKITLLEDTETLEEVVVVGYGTVKKSNVVGSIAKVGAEVIEDRPVSRVEQALQGQMAGVSVRSTSGAPGSDITINVRGAASINGESTPLYVVDGVPIESLSGINPNDIESIDVLKDAASAAIYGSRGSNGVVLVTTKKGKTGKPVILILCSGSAIGLSAEVGLADAIIQAWYPGQAGGTAVADVLFGDYNPAGRLPVTFYKATEQLPDFEDYSMQGRTYRYFEGEALFPVGYGLSYTSFEIGKARLSQKRIRENESVSLKLTVENTGKLDGDEVIQIYIRKLQDKEGPLKTLRAFKRFHLRAGEKKDVTFHLQNDHFNFFDTESNTMRVMPGEYEILYGASSMEKDLRRINIKIE